MRHLTIEYSDPELKRVFFERFILPTYAVNLKKCINDFILLHLSEKTIHKLLNWADVMDQIEYDYRVFISGQYRDLRRTYDGIRELDKLYFNGDLKIELFTGAILSWVEKDIVENELWELMPRHKKATKAIYKWIIEFKKESKR